MFRVSIVDPDAHLMKGKDNNWGFHYNLQENNRSQIWNHRRALRLPSNPMIHVKLVKSPFV